ncbi:hypothetical protein ACHWQZ_G016788 [Mnemiopsis leidyi]
MLINSIFFINHSGDIFLEKHWRSIVSRSVCDQFFDAQTKAPTPEDVPPIITTNKNYLISIYREKIYLVAVTQMEVQPLFVIEFMHRVMDTFTEYFDECTESAIKDNIIVVYQLLEEMLDNGFPLATELNILTELIKPPTIINKAVSMVTGKEGVSSVLPGSQLSNVPWRRQGVKYANNEAYFDCIEDVDAIIDASGTVVSAEIHGNINCNVHLSGMPDLSMSFINPRLLDDVSFHPCVRLKRWENEKILSFVPPDGCFVLMSYHISTQNQVAIPVYVRAMINFKDGMGKVDITVGPKQTLGKTVDNVVITVPMPKEVTGCSMTTSVGTYTFDPVSKQLRWDIGKIQPLKVPTMRGSCTLPAGAQCKDAHPTIHVDFKIMQLAVSGLKVNRLDMFNENYKPFKGVKYITKAGNFQVRT